jgi:hypothetical protein
MSLNTDISMVLQAPWHGYGSIFSAKYLIVPELLYPGQDRDVHEMYHEKTDRSFILSILLVEITPPR